MERGLNLSGDLLAALDGETFARTLLGFDPDPIQARLLREEPSQLILNCSRQWGKSTVTAIKAIHRAWSRPESLTMVVAPSERQTGEFVRKASVFVRRLGIKPRGDGYNAISLLLPNGSRMLSVPAREANSRGFSDVSLMIVDEASRVEEDHYEAMTPSLDKLHGDLWLLSTPWGKSGFFWRTWAGGDPDWTRVAVKATDCPRLPALFLEKQRKEKGDAVFRREFLCEFMDADQSLYNRDTLLGLVRPDLRPLWPGTV